MCRDSPGRWVDLWHPRRPPKNIFQYAFLGSKHVFAQASQISPTISSLLVRLSVFIIRIQHSRSTLAPGSHTRASPETQTPSSSSDESPSAPSFSRTTVVLRHVHITPSPVLAEPPDLHHLPVTPPRVDKPNQIKCQTRGVGRGRRGRGREKADGKTRRQWRWAGARVCFALHPRPPGSCQAGSSRGRGFRGILG